MLAQMAVDAGLRPIALDCFADEDTLELALETAKVASLSKWDALSALDRLIRQHGLTHAVYGSGLENEWETLAFLETRLQVLGNSSDLLRRLSDKPAFFATLADLGIRFPETRFSPPVHDQRDWLVKPMLGQGGVGIAHYTGQVIADNRPVYWQCWHKGVAGSVLFLASRGRNKILGFNRQWCCSEHPQPFLFAGICNHWLIPESIKATLSAWVDAICREYPLQGLASLDFVIEGQELYLLEVNPRIPASAQLYGKHTLTQHLQAYQGSLPDADFDRQAMGYQILYARESLRIPADLSWPNWVLDRPAACVLIGMGQPVCSIIAAGQGPDQVSDRLRQRQQFLEHFFTTRFF